MGIQKEIWERDIIELFRQSNDLRRYSVNHDMHVLQGSVVHIPRAGADPAVVKNRTSLPATVTQRTDTDLNYTLAEYTTDPVLLKDAEKVELSFDKRQSLMGQHKAKLLDDANDDILHTWLDTVTGLGALPGANILLTTGEEQVDGTRAATVADIASLRRLFNKANVPYAGRALIIPPDMFAALFSNKELLSAEYMRQPNLPEGVFARIAGFDIIERTYTPMYTTAGALKAKGAAPVVGDRQSIIAISSFAVASALGEVKVFEDVDAPTWYGDVYSALVRTGGIRLRNQGVAVLLQGTA